MKLVTSLITVLFLFVGSICFAQEQEHLLLSALTTSKKLLLFHVVYANKKYTVVDQASFNLPVQGGTTAIAPLPNDRFQIFWTTGPATQAGLETTSTNAAIKIKYLVVDQDLNKIGNVKTLPVTLSSHANFNHIPASVSTSFSPTAGMPAAEITKISFKAANNVVLKNRNESTGTLLGPNDPVLAVPANTTQVDTDFHPRLDPTSLLEREFYGAIRYQIISGSPRYLFVCGDISNPAPTAVGAFPADILNGTILPIPNSDDFNFLVLKRLNNPERIGIDNFQIDSETCRPIRNKIIISPARQNLGQLPYFGGIASAPSLISTNGGHVAFIRSEANDGVDIAMFHTNTLQGTKDSQVSNLNTPALDAGDWFVYGVQLLLMDLTSIENKISGLK